MIDRITLLMVAVALIGCDQQPKTLGAAIDGVPVSIAAVEKTNAESKVVIHGTMAKKCPVAGCWFILQDATGSIKVDTKNAGFVVIDVPLNTSLTVAGRIITNGTERLVEAVGLRY
jgi:uncharacterized protein YdeI (BOF family)